MKLLHKILLATDFSASAEQALALSIRLAKQFNSEIYVLHVIPSMELTKLSHEMIEKGVGQELKRIHDRIRSEGIPVHDVGLQVGIPFIRIIQEAEQQNVNVILLGYGTKTEAIGKSADLLGITAEKVLHKAAKPVWVVKTDGEKELQTILCPVDFSKPSERALNNAIHLARKLGAKLHILHAVPTVSDLYLGLLGGSEQKIEEKIRTHDKQLNKFLQEFDFHGVEFERIVKYGKVHRVILETASEISADLIVMGASGESDNAKVLMGSNTEYVIRELPCSIITVKSESVIRPMIDYQISDLQSHFNLGKQFLENGMPQEAIEQFKYCIDQDVLFAPAWEGLAECQERLGFSETAEDYRKKAKTIRKNLWQQQVEREIRSKHKTIGTK